MATAQTPVPLGDLAPGTGGSRPATYVLTGGNGLRTMFNADDGATGNEPWITDGTPGGTTRLADLSPGAASSTPRGYTAIGHRVVFQAYLPGVGEELAVTDGTAAGTGLLLDIRPGIANSNPILLQRFRGELLFRANDGTGERVWRTDGTPSGTFLHPALPSHFAGGLVAGNRLFWFRAAGSAQELWCWDGSTQPGVVTTFAQIGAQPPPYLAAAFEDRAIFLSPESGGARSMWSSDGTQGGTVQLVSSIPHPGTVVGARDQLFYTSGASGSADALWVSDGTPGAELQVGNFGPYAGTISGLTACGGRVVFTLLQITLPAPTASLWVSDGSPAGTFSLGVAGSRVVATGETRVAFVSSDPAHGAELWASDGTVTGTARLTDLNPGPASSFDGLPTLRYQGGRLFFWADDGVHGREPWTLHVGAGAQRVGDGCGAGAIPELRGSDPVLGADVAIDGRSQLPLAPGFVVLGPAAVLPQLVAGACDLHVDLGFAPILVPFATDAAGGFSLPPLPVPASPLFDGARFAAQAALAAPAAPLLGIAISNAVLLAIGG